MCGCVAAYWERGAAVAHWLIDTDWGHDRSVQRIEGVLSGIDVYIRPGLSGRQEGDEAMDSEFIVRADFYQYYLCAAAGSLDPSACDDVEDGVVGPLAEGMRITTG